jgi:hypothetical protein
MIICELSICSVTNSGGAAQVTVVLPPFVGFDDHDDSI